MGVVSLILTLPFRFSQNKFDGIVVGNPCNSGFGGVIIDYLAESILSFSSPFSVCSVNEAETILLRKGFRQSNRAISCASSSISCLGIWQMSQRKLRGYLFSFKAYRLVLNYEEVCNDMTDILAKEGVGDQILPWTVPLNNAFCILGMGGLGGNRGYL